MDYMGRVAPTTTCCEMVMLGFIEASALSKEEKVFIRLQIYGRNDLFKYTNLLQHIIHVSRDLWSLRYRHVSRYHPVVVYPIHMLFNRASHL